MFTIYSAKPTCYSLSGFFLNSSLLQKETHFGHFLTWWGTPLLMSFPKEVHFKCHIARICTTFVVFSLVMGIMWAVSCHSTDISVPPFPGKASVFLHLSTPLLPFSFYLALLASHWLWGLQGGQSGDGWPLGCHWSWHRYWWLFPHSHLRLPPGKLTAPLASGGGRGGSARRWPASECFSGVGHRNQLQQWGKKILKHAEFPSVCCFLGTRNDFLKALTFLWKQNRTNESWIWRNNCNCVTQSKWKHDRNVKGPLWNRFISSEKYVRNIKRWWWWGAGTQCGRVWGLDLLY